MGAQTTSVANAVGVPRVLDPSLVTEAQRQFDICNSCRYCEGLCAVFPALERRSLFTEGDILFLANLCHDCRECFDACPYASPHEFALDLPPLMSAIRHQTYAGFAQPKRLGAAMMESSRIRGLVSAVVVMVVFVLGLALIGWESLADEPAADAFYELVPWSVMTSVAFGLSGLAVVSMVAGMRAYWRDTADRRMSVGSVVDTLYAVLMMRNMRGGGPGCAYPTGDLSYLRKTMHSLVMYGFGATFLATVLAAIWQEILGRFPPYPIVSAPVISGIVGGAATVLGCIGLVWLKLRSRRDLAAESTLKLDWEFIILLVLVNLSGFAVLIVRSSSALGVALLVHLGLVAAFFVSLSFGKFVHGTYRSLALTQDALERMDERAS